MIEAYVLLIRNVNTDREKVCVLQRVSTLWIGDMEHHGEWHLSGPGIQAKFYTLQQVFVDVSRWHYIVWSREVTSA